VCVAACCRVSQILQDTIRYGAKSGCVAVRCSVRCVRCSVLPCVVDSPCCSVLPCVVDSDIMQLPDARDTATYSATSCNILHILPPLSHTHPRYICSATHCNTLQHTATQHHHYRMLTLATSALQHTATHCNTLQHTATHCNTLPPLSHAQPRYLSSATHCSILQNPVTYCNTPQHTATHRNIRQHTVNPIPCSLSPPELYNTLHTLQQTATRTATFI